MLITNKSMRHKMKNLKISPTVINKGLSKILDEGFVNIDDCYLLKFFQKNNMHVNLKEFHDRTAYECFINSFHVEDYVDQDYLLQGIFFTNAIFSLWSNNFGSKKLNVLINCDEDDVIIKVFFKREDETYLADDIESYSESILLTDAFIYL